MLPLMSTSGIYGCAYRFIFVVVNFAKYGYQEENYGINSHSLPMF